MAGLADLIGAFATPSAGEQTAATSTPMDYRAFFGPILESVAAEAKRASDPYDRIGDVGRAIFDSLSSGTPYARNLAALGEQRTKVIHGAGNMFLNVLGQERQVEQLKQEGAYRNAQLALQTKNLEETARQHKETVRVAERGQDIGLVKQTLAQKEAEAIRQEQDHDATRKTLSGATNDPIKFASILDANPEYVQARKARDWEKANKIAAAAAEAVGKKTDLPSDLRIRDVAYQNVDDAAKELQGLLKTGPSVIDPTDRARIRQLWSKLVLQYGIATGRGANYTELEKQLVTDILGQSPTDLRYRSIESMPEFQKRLGVFQEGMSRELQNLRGSGQRAGPTTSPNWRAEPEGPKVETRGPGYEIQAPPGWRATGRFTKDGRPIFTDGTNEAAPPRK